MDMKPHGGTKSEWKLLHTDQDLDRFVGRMKQWQEPYPEPVILDM